MSNNIKQRITKQFKKKACLERHALKKRLHIAKKSHCFMPKGRLTFLPFLDLISLFFELCFAGRRRGVPASTILFLLASKSLHTAKAPLLSRERGRPLTFFCPLLLSIIDRSCVCCQAAPQVERRKIKSATSKISKGSREVKSLILVMY